MIFIFTIAPVVMLLMLHLYANIQIGVIKAGADTIQIVRRLNEYA